MYIQFSKKMKKRHRFYVNLRKKKIKKKIDQENLRLVFIIGNVFGSKSFT